MILGLNSKEASSKTHKRNHDIHNSNIRAEFVLPSNITNLNTDLKHYAKNANMKLLSSLRLNKLPLPLKTNVLRSQI